jgi:two-component system, cell cycle sensor histidine kinase and response regulator CckA
MGGKETIAELLKIDPEVRAVVSSGYSNDSILANYKKYGFKARLSKPFRSADIDEIIKEVMIQEL